MKTKRLVAPVSEKYHNKVVAHVEEREFDSVAAYIRWLIRQDMRTE